jgi:ABC-type lipoprotein release transport system permease subunit
MVDVERMYVATFSARQMLGDIVIESSAVTSPGRATADDGALSFEAANALNSVFLRLKPRFILSVPFLNFSGTLQGAGVSLGFTGLAFDVASGDAMRGERFRWNTLAGAPFESDNDTGLLLGKGLAELVGCTWEGQHTESRNGVMGYEPAMRAFRCPAGSFQLLVATEAGQANAESFSVRGIVATGFAELDDRLVVLPLKAARALLDTQKTSYVTAKVLGGLGSSAAEAAEAVTEAMEARGFQVRATPWPQHAFGDLYVRTMEFLGIFRNFVIGVILVVAALAVFSTFSKTVRERRKETSTLRSFGYLPSQILGLFAAEAACLGVAGAFVGTLACGFVVPLVNAFGMTYKAGFLSDPVPFRVGFSLPHTIAIWALVVSLAVFSSLIAAWRGVRVSIVDGLKDGG